MLGLIGGALSGGAEAAQENAKTRIKTMHDKAMERMRQKYQTSEREAGQEFQSSEREAGQDFTLTRDETQQSYAQDNARLQHEMSMVQERYRQQQQNNRTAITSRTKPQWQVLTDGEGGYVQYDPVSNTTRPVPEGVNFGSIGSGELTDIQDRQLDRAEREINAIYESATNELGEQRPLTKEEAATVKGWRDLESEILNQGQGGSGGGQGGNDGPTILEQLLQGEGGDNPDPGGNNDEVKPPPGVDEPIETGGSQDESVVTGLINQGISEQQNRQSEAEEGRVLGNIDQQLRQMKSQLRIAGTGPGVTQAERDAAAEKVIQMAKELEDNGLMDIMQPVQSEAIQDIVTQAIQYSSQY